MPNSPSPSAAPRGTPHRVLIVAAHPDDDVIGMGGTMAKMAAEGALVSVVYVAPGGRSTRSFPISDAEMGRMREAEARRAAVEVAGAADVSFLRLEYPHEPAERAAWAEQAGQGLRKALRAARPQEIYLPHPLDGHRTHRAVTQAMLALLEESPAAGMEVFGFETWTPIESPTSLIDITAFEEVKRRAIRCHESQVRDKAYEDGIMGLNRYRAVFSNANRVDQARYIEAFIKIPVGTERRR